VYATYHPRRRRAVPLPRFGKDVVRPQALGSKARVADRSAIKPEIWSQGRLSGLKQTYLIKSRRLASSPLLRIRLLHGDTQGFLRLDVGWKYSW
jgi:hypothetical protein